MHSINIDDLELRWRWIYGGEQLGFKSLMLVTRAIFAAKLFCVPGEAIEMDGKQLTLNKGLNATRKTNLPMRSDTYVVRHDMTLGEMTELPVVKALFEVLTIPKGNGHRGPKAFDRVQVAAVLTEHTAAVLQRLQAMEEVEDSDDNDDNDDNNDNNDGSLAVTPWLSPEPTVTCFNAAAEANQGRLHSNVLEVLATLLGLVGHEMQGKHGKQFTLSSVLKLRRDMVLLSVGDGTMTAGQLLATLHMAALFHLGVQSKSNGRYTMKPVDPADFAAGKHIFEAIRAERKPALDYLSTMSH